MLHKALKTVREVHRMQQGELAERLGISRSHLSEIESGKKAASVELLAVVLDERLRGLDGGADDFLLKPFAMAELWARMRAVLRRRGGNALSLLDNGEVSFTGNYDGAATTHQKLETDFAAGTSAAWTSQARNFFASSNRLPHGSAGATPIGTQGAP
mgnify:CR=1 FL=1